MAFVKRKGYMVERKIRILFEENGWNVVRAGASLGEADLICMKRGKCVLLQVKSTKKKTLYYNGYMENSLSGFPFYLVVDFGYGKISVLEPTQKVKIGDGMKIGEFLQKI
ncbi:MAG: hypothetical protein V1944_01780 [Candidatus Aenigmatarchaeota archaeon]